MKKDIIIKVDQVSFAYKKHYVLKNLSLQFERGKITTILGQNGCGKSTLFQLLTRGLKMGEGRILLEGRTIQSYSLKEFSRIVASVSQFNSAPESITIEELVRYGRYPYRKRKEREEDEEQIQRALELTDLESIRYKNVADLSGGQLQRVWIAMAIAQNTKVLLLDEPTTYLDIYYQLDLLKLVRKLNKELGLTVIMILHDINQAVSYSDDIVALKDGEVSYSGNAKEFVTTKRLKEIYHVELEVLEKEEQNYVLSV